ncbi:MAG: inorganic diphosphatase [Candidatus Micrarchaeota archaeon]|nr:inorganic diphosphatase [Candidatus Micrarchaeota archaeon]
MQKNNGLASATQEARVLLEISSGSGERYKVDPESHSKELRGVLKTPLPKDLHYGFLGHTQAEDGDELDIIVVSSRRIEAGDEIVTRPIGMLISYDERGSDDKIIAVDMLDATYSHIKEINELPEGMRGTIWEYTISSKYESSPDGFVRPESFSGSEAAKDKIDGARKRWILGIEKRDMA